MTLDTNPLHPRFTNAADNFRFHADMRWVHKEAVELHGGDLEDARKWITMVWRTNPDAVETAIILAVVHLIDEAMARELAQMTRAIASKHAWRTMATSHLLESAA